MKRIIAYVVFVLGISTAIVGGAKLPDEQVEYLKEKQKLTVAAAEELKGWPPEKLTDRFSDATPIFGVGVLLAVAGIVLWRNDIRKHRLMAAGSMGEPGAAMSGECEAVNSPRAYIESIQSAMVSLSATGTVDAPGEGLLSSIDSVLAEHVAPFVEVREQLVDELGLGDAAPVMLSMARGERLLNRAWSAEADGYRKESLDSIAQAQQAFTDAAEQLGRHVTDHTN